MENRATHIGLIIDGNRRWAKDNGVSIKDGYKSGLIALENVIKHFAGSEVKCISVYAFSSENDKRPEEEKLAIMKVIGEFIDKHPQNVALSFVGDERFIPANLLTKIHNFDNENKEFDILVNICIGYGARNDIVRGARHLLERAIDTLALCQEEGLSENDASKQIDALFTEDGFKNCLSTSFLPPLDMIIRFGGEKRLSNFMLYEAAYSELYFSDTLWPDATSAEIEEFIEDFKNTKRNYGV
ncbi:MAG: polyprenyl diphosphate synthase [Christensenellales bacterium]